MKRFMGKALGMVLSVSMMVSFVPGMTVFAATDDGTGQNVGEIGEVMELPEDVQDVIDMIKALPSVDNITLDDYDAESKAENAFNELDEGEKYSVAISLGYDSIDEVISLFSAYREKRSSLLDKALEEVVDLIDAIPENLTLEDADAVAAARKAYDKLGGLALQSDVSNYDKLVAAEKKLEELKAEEEQAKAEEEQAKEVDAVIKLINDLPDPEDVVYDDYGDVYEAYYAYSSLTDKQKEMISEELVKKLNACRLVVELFDLADSVEVVEYLLDTYPDYLSEELTAEMIENLDAGKEILDMDSPMLEEVLDANHALIESFWAASEIIGLHFTVVDGADGIVWLTNSDSGLTIRIKQEGYEDYAYELFLDAGEVLLIDGEEFPEGAVKTSKGSLIIEIIPDFLKTLSVGEHKLTVKFDNGVTMDLVITIKDAANVPASGESVSAAAYVGIAMVVLAAACFVVNKRLAKKES